MTWVFSALVTATGQCWAWFDLYMPKKCWAKDPARRKKADIPRGLAFATKPDLAIAQVRAVIERGVRVCWVAANEVYGRSGDFRAACRALLLSYVVIVPCGVPGARASPRARIRSAWRAAARGAVFRAAVRRERDERPPLGMVGAARHCGPRKNSSWSGSWNGRRTSTRTTCATLPPAAP